MRRLANADAPSLDAHAGDASGIAGTRWWNPKLHGPNRARRMAQQTGIHHRRRACDSVENARSTRRRADGGRIGNRCRTPGSDPINCAALLRRSSGTVVASSQRIDSLSSIASRPARLCRLSERVQMRACTTPPELPRRHRPPPWCGRKIPVVLPTPAGPSPLRPRFRRLKLISVVSCAVTIRRPKHAIAVRRPAVAPSLPRSRVANRESVHRQLPPDLPRSAHNQRAGGPSTQPRPAALSKPIGYLLRRPRPPPS